MHKNLTKATAYAVGAAVTTPVAVGVAWWATVAPDAYVDTAGGCVLALGAGGLITWHLMESGCDPWAGEPFEGGPQYKRDLEVPATEEAAEWTGPLHKGGNRTVRRIRDTLASRGALLPLTARKLAAWKKAGKEPAGQRHALPDPSLERLERLARTDEIPAAPPTPTRPVIVAHERKAIASPPQMPPPLDADSNPGTTYTDDTSWRDYAGLAELLAAEAEGARDRS
jgi:hypothetical protein